MLSIKSISTNLKIGDDEIWHASEDQIISYPSDGNESCFAVEDNSFWFKHRNNCITSIINSYPPEDNGTIFDIGGGNGVVSIGLVNAGFNVALVEPGRIGAYNAKKRGVRNVICATIDTANFNKHSLHAAGLFDVVEHVEDDLSFLQSIRGIIKKGGLLYVTVPSYTSLWSADDVLAGHYRRYTIKDISKILRSAGFVIEFSSYFFRFLPVPIYLLRTLPYKVGLSGANQQSDKFHHDHTIKSRFTARILNSILESEVENINRKKAMRFGSSCLIVARSPLRR